MNFKVYKKDNEVIVVFEGPEDAINVVTEVLKGVYGVKSTPVPALESHPIEEVAPPAINDEEEIPLFLQEETEIFDDDNEEEPPTETVNEPPVSENNAIESVPAVPEMEIKDLRKLIFSHNKGKGNRVINAVFKKYEAEYESFGKFMYNVTEDVAKEIYIKLVEAGIIK